ncbi:hypothetical protein PoB_006658800 [Plakobranchus ocellatus]|uniref:Uncharacterized protein n=1 Tax=Plakobranchus ocellatus TaxID=259542 RepID=A0AAV4D7D0_9GAST|nr:hypothetical protein PoB_006658800 [Plakobranchus ocellatus]
MITFSISTFGKWFIPESQKLKSEESRVIFMDEKLNHWLQSHAWGVSGTVTCESVLRSAGTLLSRVLAPPPAPWPDGRPGSLRSSCCGLAIYRQSNRSHA